MVKFPWCFLVLLLSVGERLRIAKSSRSRKNSYPRLQNFSLSLKKATEQKPGGFLIPNPGSYRSKLIFFHYRDRGTCSFITFVARCRPYGSAGVLRNAIAPPGVFSSGPNTL